MKSHLLACMLLLFSSHILAGRLFIDDGLTHTINDSTTAPEGIEIRGYTSGAITTVNVVSPAVIGADSVFSALVDQYAELNILGGTLLGIVRLGGGANAVSINIDGGFINGIDIGGGLIVSVIADDGTSIEITGGSFGGGLLCDGATFNVYGSGFAINDSPVPFGPLSGPGRLTGILADGSPINNDVFFDGCAGFILHEQVSAPILSCSGFISPLDAGPVVVKGNRNLPFKLQLLNSDLVPQTDIDIIAKPVLEVRFDSGLPDVDPIVLSNDDFAVGLSSDGNEFEFTDNIWRHKFKAKNLSAKGTYIFKVITGDTSEYSVEPTCSAIVVYEE